MVYSEDTILCDGCGIEVLGAPIVKDGSHYCCLDCVHGFECQCEPALPREDL